MLPPSEEAGESSSRCGDEGKGAGRKDRTGWKDSSAMRKYLRVEDAQEISAMSGPATLPASVVAWLATEGLEAADVLCAPRHRFFRVCGLPSASTDPLPH